MSKILRDPFFIFILAGGLTFALYAAVTESEKPIIQMDAELESRIVANQEALRGRALDEAEKKALIEAYIRDEILIQEAAKRNLHALDAVARTQLVEKMRFFLSEEPGEPAEELLKQFYQTHTDLYVTDPKISFDHVFFAEPPDDDNLLEKILEMEDFSTLGERFWLGPQLKLYDREVLAGMLGADFVETLFALPEGEWSGPHLSKRGTHYVRVTRHLPSRLMTYAEVSHLIKQDWEAARREESLNARIEELKQGYEIVVE